MLGYSTTIGPKSEFYAREAIERMENGGTSPTAPEGYGQREIDDAKSSLYGAIGNLYCMQDSIPQAMAFYAKAGAIFDKYGWNTSNSVLYYNIGETWAGEGDLKAAEKAYRKALGYAEMEKDSLWIATSHKGLGRMYLDMGKMGKALRELHLAEEYFAAGILLLGRRLRASHKEQEETAVVMEETLADLQHSKGPADGIDAQVSDREKEILELLIKFDAANTAELVLRAKEGNLL